MLLLCINTLWFYWNSWFFIGTEEGVKKQKVHRNPERNFKKLKFETRVSKEPSFKKYKLHLGTSSGLHFKPKNYLKKDWNTYLQSLHPQTINSKYDL